MQKEIRHTWHFNRSPQEVWEYLTKPELLEQWLMKNDFQLILGHKFRFFCSTISYCEVLEIIPEKRLSYSWKVKNPGGEMTVDSIVVWTLLEKDGGTELRLLHDGFTRLEDYIGHNNGWVALGNKITEMLNAIKNADIHA